MQPRLPILRSSARVRRVRVATLLLLAAWGLSACGSGASDAKPTHGGAGAAAEPIPCFPEPGREVFEISGVRITDATMERYARQLRAQREGMSEAYSRQKALESVIIPQAVSYAAAGPEKVRTMSRRVRALRERLRGGEEFGAVAREESDDLAGREADGEVGWVSRAVPGGRMNMAPTFEEAMFSTPVGEVSEPFATLFGFHLLKVHEERASPDRPGQRERRVSQILVSWDGPMKADGALRSALQEQLAKRVREARVKVLDEAWASVVPGIYRER